MAWGKKGEGKPPQVKTQGHKLPTNGPDHTTRPKGTSRVYSNDGPVSCAMAT